MMGLVLVVHIIVCILLIGIILIQAGRGGGLVEGFSGVESMFGTKTNVFLTRATTVLSSLFFITCLSLALLSAKQGRSLLRDIKTAPAAVTPAANQTQTEIPALGSTQNQNVSTTEAPSPQ